MSGRVRRVCVTLLVAACVSLAAAAPAGAGTYVEGVVGQPFTLQKLGEGLTIEGVEDQTLVLDLDAVTHGPSTQADCWCIHHGQVGAAGDFSFDSFRVHADFSQATGVSLAVYFHVPLDDVEPDWRRAPYTGTDETGAWVFTPPPYSGGHYLAYKLVFTLADTGATGTATIADFAVDWGEYVAPPDDDGDGGKNDDDRNDEGDGTGEQPSGVAYMGGSDGDRDGGGGGAGSGSSGQGVGATGRGSEAGGGDSGVDTDAPVAAEPPASAARMVTGYPLGVCELSGGTTGGTGGSGSAGGPAPGDGQAGTSWVGLGWLVLALVSPAPFAAAELDRRRVRRRLRTLVESTPDAPASGVAKPA